MDKNHEMEIFNTESQRCGDTEIFNAELHIFCNFVRKKVTILLKVMDTVISQPFPSQGHGHIDRKHQYISFLCKIVCISK